MPGRTSKYTAKTNEAIRTSLMDVLFNAEDALTVNEIQTRKIDLVNVTPQKLARELNEFVDGGLVMKAKSSRKGNKMVYKLIRE